MEGVDDFIAFIYIYTGKGCIGVYGTCSNLETMIPKKCSCMFVVRAMFLCYGVSLIVVVSMFFSFFSLYIFFSYGQRWACVLACELEL